MERRSRIEGLIRQLQSVRGSAHEVVTETTAALTRAQAAAECAQHAHDTTVEALKVLSHMWADVGLQREALDLLLRLQEKAIRADVACAQTRTAQSWEAARCAEGNYEHARTLYCEGKWEEVTTLALEQLK